MNQVVKNSKGDAIKLSPFLQNYANSMQRKFEQEDLKNALGTDISFTTLTAIQQRVLEQRFFTIDIAKYVPMRVGNDPWAQQSLTLREYALAGAFENGYINLATNGTRLAQDEVAIDSILVPRQGWAKQIVWSLPEVAVASRTGNWDIVDAKERTRKRDWDLGIQKIAFLGDASLPGINGLLTQPNVTINTSVIAKNISAMTAAEFKAFVGAILSAYQVNASYTVMPDTFLVPQADYVAMTSPSSDVYPVRSQLEILRDALRVATNNPNFEVMGLPYGNTAISGLSNFRYVLYRRDADSIRMEIPVDYATTMTGTFNNFQFSNVAYGQFQGTFAYRPKEMLYFDHA